MGSDEELTAFIELNNERLVGVLSLYCGDALLAEEMAQDALIRLCRDWSKVRTMDHPVGWLHRVAINFAKSHFRRRRAEQRVQSRLEQEPMFPIHVDLDSALDIRVAVSRLPHRQKTVLVLHYYTDLTFAQIADIVDAPEGTVKSLAHRAIKRIRAVEDHERGEPSHVR